MTTQCIVHILTGYAPYINVTYNKMRNFIYVILSVVIFSCQGDFTLDGEWERIEYIDEEDIPQVISSELGVPLSNELKIEIYLSLIQI